MAKINLKTKFFNNLIYAFSAQVISLGVSLLMSVIVPKFLGVTEYALWQLFIFYTNYVSFSQLGIVDGLYLKLGGKNYEELDYNKLGGEFHFYSLVQIVIGTAIVLFAYSILGISDKFFVFIFVAIYLVIYDISRFLGLIFQAVNNTRWFSIASMIDRITILCLGAVAILSNHIFWYWFAIIYITGITVSLIYTFRKGNKIVFSKSKTPIKSVIQDMFDSSCIGVNLMISNLASTLILGCGRQFIELKWGLDTFGRVSFALSMTNFFLLFINQVSLVMFPALKKVDESSEIAIFKKINKCFSILSPIVYVVYIPAAYFLSKWLPQYEISLSYLMIFMPICVFDGKMQMIYTTYLKVLRMERILLKINLVSLLFSFASCCISVFVFEDMELLLFLLVIVIMFRSVLAYNIVIKKMKEKDQGTMISDFVFSVVFLVSNILFSDFEAFVTIALVYFFFLMRNRKYIRIFEN